MERPTLFGWRCYSWIVMILLTALIGVSVALGVVANEPRSMCAGKKIVSKGVYDPTQHCLTWASEGLRAMPDGVCSNECDQELYDTHYNANGRRLQIPNTEHIICKHFCDEYIDSLDGAQCIACCNVHVMGTAADNYNCENSNGDLIGRAIIQSEPTTPPSLTSFCNSLFDQASNEHTCCTNPPSPLSSSCTKSKGHFANGIWLSEAEGCKHFCVKYIDSLLEDGAKCIACCNAKLSETTADNCENSYGDFIGRAIIQSEPTTPPPLTSFCNILFDQTSNEHTCCTNRRYRSYPLSSSCNKSKGHFANDIWLSEAEGTALANPPGAGSD